MTSLREIEGYDLDWISVAEHGGTGCSDGLQTMAVYLRLKKSCKLDITYRKSLRPNKNTLKYSHLLEYVKDHLLEYVKDLFLNVILTKMLEPREHLILLRI
jgi:hypothetical protein